MWIPSLFRKNREQVFVPAPVVAELSSRDRVAIRDWLDLPTTRLVLGLMQAKHPGSHLPPGFSTVARSEWDERAAVNYLNRIRGWDTFRNTLLTLHIPTPDTVQIVETFPDPNKS